MEISAPNARRPEGTGARDRARTRAGLAPLARPLTARLAGLGLATVLILLTGFSLWVAATTSRAARNLSHATAVADAYDQARFAVSQEESLERKYRLEPSSEVRAWFAQASAALQAALGRVRAEGDPADRADVDTILAEHGRYLQAIQRMFAAVDARRPGRVLAIDHRAVDPAFSDIERRIFVEASAHEALAMGDLHKLSRYSTLVLVATPITFTTGLALLAVFSVLLMRYRRHVAEADRRELRRTSEEQRRLLQQTMRSAEMERMRIAGELHDGAVQHLTALDYRLESIRRRLLEEPATELRGSLQASQDWVRKDISDLRHMMAELRLPVLDQRGLDVAIRALSEELTRESPVRVEVTSDIDGKLDPTLETVVYRVAQETLRNVVKHAGANQVWIELRETPDAVCLEVRDDGVGFDPEVEGELREQGHFGIVGMRERVELAGGTFELTSRAGYGTTVRAALPVSKAEP